MLLYLKIGQLFDQGEVIEAKTLFQDFQAMEESETFYNTQVIGLDLLRVNLYQIMTKVYESTDDKETAEILYEQSLNLEATLSLYRLKEPDEA